MHAFSSATLEASLCHLPTPDLAVSPPLLASFPHFISSHSSLLASELAPMLEPSGLLPSELSYSCSSGPCSSYESPTSKPQRSMSHGPGVQISMLFDLESSVRRAYRSNDLQGRTEMTNSNESSLIIEGMSTKACRYSPEEKRQRIEKYKTKRNQRNFNKKIKYECRKTLADSRRRIRGRFARNEEVENSNSTSSPTETWSCYDNATTEEDGQDDGSWITFLDSYSVNFIP
ncbi:zinc finger protein CONSTANS-LIKE 5-like isoform X1 [Cucurbita maxima]|uniref:Zinc finger protein CONSTANS-LIKE 5-like isoform X1 n=1 Tax=Cucurbita maxima TaxID=3661 RepID=A0A6J1I3X3_CUCMA|nr:zinc finger protein CONSTANS-LIKE 5-like isoform X1 [Cucurbita maxima]